MIFDDPYEAVEEIRMVHTVILNLSSSISLKLVIKLCIVKSGFYNVSFPAYFYRDASKNFVQPVFLQRYVDNSNISWEYNFS